MPSKTSYLAEGSFEVPMNILAIYQCYVCQLVPCGIMEQPPQAADPQPGENSLVFNEREHFPWRRATWLRH